MLPKDHLGCYEDWLFDVAGAAEQITTAGLIAAIDSQQGGANRCAALLIMNVVTGGAFHFVIKEQGLVEAAANKAGSVPLFRDGRSIEGQFAFGTMALSRAGFEVWADAKVSPNNVVARVLPPGHPVGGPQLEPETEPRQFWTEPVKDETGEAMEDYGRHARNFLDCMKSRQTPLTDLESGHRVVTVCHLANISMKTGRKLVWNAEKEEIVGDSEANQMLVRAYRKPWDAELKALGVS